MDLEKINELNQMMENQENGEKSAYDEWKHNSPLLYDTLITHVLDWPTLTAQFLPCLQQSNDGNNDCYKLVLGTHTDSVRPNYLIIAKVIIFLQIHNIFQN